VPIPIDDGEVGFTRRSVSREGGTAHELSRLFEIRALLQSDVVAGPQQGR
jgi:hypothetical protein